MMEPREIRVDFHIDDWSGTAQELEDAIDYFGEFFGVTLSSIGMAGNLTGKANA
jgi:hypothetical protein